MRPVLIALLLVLAGGGAVPAARAQSGGEQVRIGLGGPIDELASVESFGASLAAHLTWQVFNSARPPAARLSAIRIDRGRVTRGARSGPMATTSSPERVAASFSESDWPVFLRECCLGAEDPPMAVVALSGSAYLSELELETAIAGLVERGVIDGAFGMARPHELDWGRHVVIVIAASADTPIAVRPLLLLLDRR